MSNVTVFLQLHSDGHTSKPERLRYRTDLANTSEVALKDVWLTSPWSQIEPAMAYQIGLPVLILREKGVIDEGILERGVLGLYMPQFDLDEPVDEVSSPGLSGMKCSGVGRGSLGR